jgi:hypothetical protein
MTKLRTVAGVDLVQWKAVSWTLLRTDFRLPGQAANNTYSLQSFAGFTLMFLVYGLFGLGPALVSFLNPDPLLTGTLSLAYVTMLVTTAILTQHGSTMLSTTDYVVLGPRPVSATTFLAIRLTNVLFHTWLITSFMGWPVIVAQTFASGFNPARGAATAVALYACALAMTLAFVVAYGALLRYVGARRLQRVLGYFQMGFGFLAYGGVVALMDSLGRSVVASATLPRGPWLLLLPPAWYASYIEIGGGSADLQSWIRAGLSVIFIAGMLAMLRTRLALDYGDRLGALAAASSDETPSSRSNRAILFRRNEPRAVALLVRAHFRHDLRVRLGILSIVPLTLLYVYMGARDGGGGDPFVRDAGRTGMDFMAYAVLFFPWTLLQQLGSSESHKASWIYFATPADRARIIIAMEHVVVAYFLVPFVVFIAGVFTWRFADPGHALVHALYLGLIGLIVFQTAILVHPTLPFSNEPQKNVNTAKMFGWMMGVMVGGTLTLIAIKSWVYPSWLRVAVVAAGLVVLAILLDRAVRARAQMKSSRV